MSFGYRSLSVVVLAAGLILTVRAPAQAQSCFSDSFAYPDGGLGGNGSWPGSTAGSIDVLSGSVKITGGGTVVTSTVTLTNPCQACGDDTITTIIKARGGTGTSTVYNVEFNDASGFNLARWNSTGILARGRLGGIVTPTQTLSNIIPVTAMNWTDATLSLTKVGAFASYTFTAGDTISITAGTGVTIGTYGIAAKVNDDTLQLASDINGAGADIADATVNGNITRNSAAFDELKAVIDIKHNLTQFFINGSPLGSLQNDAAQTGVVGNAVARIVIQRTGGTANDSIYFDDISVSTCSGTCAASVTPSSVQTASAPVSGAATPSSISYTVKNILTDSLSYTAAEVDSSGAAFDYPWLSLSPTSGGPLATNATDTVVATLDPVTPALTAGIYEGFIKFTDLCTPNRSYTRQIRLFVGTNQACLAETFPYPDGALNVVGNDWPLVVSSYTGSPVPTTSLNALDVAGTKLKVQSVTACNGSFVCTKVFNPVGADTNGKITCKVYMEKGSGDVGNIWKIFFARPEDGLVLAEWDGGVTVARARDESQDDPATQGNGFGTLATGPGNFNLNLTGTGTYDELKVVIDTVNATGQYFFNGSPVGSFLPVPDATKSFINDSRMRGCRIGRAVIQRQNRGTGTFNATMNWDNISVEGDCNVVVPLGSVIATSPVGGPATPVSSTYSLQNSYSTSVTESVQEVDVTGSAFDHTWLSLDKSTLGPLATEGTDSLLASFIPGALPGGEYVGFLKFTDNFASPQTQTRALKLLVLGDDCFVEGFPYMDGPLVGQPGWGTTTNPPALASGSGGIDVTGGIVKLTGSTQAVAMTAIHSLDTACQACPTNGLISVKMKARGGRGASFTWTVALEDTSATPLVLASWNGQGTVVRGRQGGAITSNQLFSNCFTVTGMNWTDATKLLTKVGAFAGYTFTAGDSISITAGTGVTTGAYDIVAKISNDTIQLASDINGAGGDIVDTTVVGNVASVNPAAPFDNLEILINTSDTLTVNGIPPNASRYYFNGVLMAGSNPIGQATGATNAIGRIRIQRESNTGGAGHFVSLDDLSVHRCVQICNDPVFDVRDESNNVVADGKVTSNDYNVFAACAPGPNADRNGFNALSFECKCMDVDHNSVLDMDDFARFQRCYTGAAGGVNPNCDN